MMKLFIQIISNFNKFSRDINYNDFQINAVDLWNDDRFFMKTINQSIEMSVCLMTIETIVYETH